MNWTLVFDIFTYLVIAGLVVALIHFLSQSRAESLTTEVGWKNWRQEVAERASDRVAHKKALLDLEVSLASSRAAYKTSDEQWRSANKQLEFLKDAIRRGDRVTVDERGIVTTQQQVRYSFDPGFGGTIYQFDSPILGLFTGQRTPEQRIADLSKENNRLNEMLATEKDRSKHLRNWLIFLLSLDDSAHVAGQLQLHKAASKFELREERLDGTLRLRIRRIGLGEDVPDHSL